MPGFDDFLARLQPASDLAPFVDADSDLDFSCNGLIPLEHKDIVAVIGAAHRCHGNHQSILPRRQDQLHPSKLPGPQQAFLIPEGSDGLRTSSLGIYLRLDKAQFSLEDTSGITAYAESQRLADGECRGLALGDGKAHLEGAVIRQAVEDLSGPDVRPFVHEPTPELTGERRQN